jgi:serine protease
MLFATEFPLNRFLVQMRVVLICAIAAWLTACGGGGGDAPPASTNNVPAPVAPEADAGGDRAAMRGSAVTLDGTASSDPDGNIVSFAWTQTAGPTVTLTNADQAQVSFTAPDLADPTDLEFELTVTDNDGLSASDSVTITVVPQTFSISGVISVAASTDTDSDVNDPDAAFQRNDTPAEAQTISNPVTLGGHVNRPGAGEPGRSQVNGDVSDFYRVALVTGETISLLVAEFTVGDVDLYLWDASGTTILNSSLSQGQFEQLTVPSTGEYLVEAFSFSGASNYILIIGQAQPSVSVGGFRLSDDFIPGDVIVRYRDESMAPAGQAEQTRVESTHRLSRRAGARNRAMLMRFGQRRRSGLPSQEPVAMPGIDRMAALPSDEYRQKYETLLALKALNLEPSVAYAEPNYLRKPLFTPNDQFYDLQWHYPLINLPAAWDVTRGASVTVAVIDTGVLLNHPDLQNQLVSGYDFISDPGNSLDGDGIDPNPNDPGDGGSFAPSSFHGSHVAGTVAAATDNTIGVAGVAGDARILPLRVCGFLGCSSFDIIQAVRYAAGLSNSSGTTINPPVDVINLSLGGGSPSGAEQAAFDAARAAGVVAVAAAGNESTTAPSYPAAYQNVISVSAVAIDSSLASYSNRGSTIDVAAPGGDFGTDVNGDGFVDFVLSTGADDSSGLIDLGYVFFAGTSMASPHVAGVIALMKAVNAALTPGQIDQMLASGDLTDDLGDAGRDNSFGYGLINAQKAVAAAQNAGGAPPPDNPTLGVTPGALNFGATNSVIEITVRNVRTGVLNLIDFTIPVPWVTVDPVPGQVDPEGLGIYTVTVDRSGLADGIHSTTITAHSDVNDAPIEIIVQVSPIPLGSDAGFVYVLLLDAQTGNSAGRCDNDFVTGQCSVSVVNGQYAFTFVDVAPGDYQVVAGTDANNDLFICDAGEACGAYLTIPQPSDITVVDAALSGIDFQISHTAADGIGGQFQDPGPSANAPAGHRRRP